MAPAPHPLNRDEARKAELISELAWAREHLAANACETLHDLNVVGHLRHSISERKTAWFTGAALTGGLLSWVLGRKKKQKPAPKQHPPARVEIPQTGYVGMALAVITFVFNLLKPTLSKLASRKIAELAARNQ
jgi:hypothetical protein